MITEQDFKDAFIARLAGIDDSCKDVCPTCKGSGVVGADKQSRNEIKWNGKNKITRTIEFPSGEIANAIVRHYRKGGSILEYAEYKNYKKHGKTTKYSSDGTIQECSIYELGKLKEKEIYNRYGKIIEKREYKNGRLHGFNTMYKYANGKRYISEIFEHKSGTRSGLSCSFDSSGRKTSDSAYGGYYGYASVNYGNKGNPISVYIQNDISAKLFNKCSMASKHGTHKVLIRGKNYNNRYKVVKLK